ncbi:fatty oxidation complex subunit alpha [Bacteriovorax stolpii]|uniref:enoyl-CoA hydratase n=1 Tax=Bacteriovorax stolpii TaxID=960 RepID=A0A2K9NS94_BACTC|nr:3-hydroxyacyl-CoA dehydrogenase NAD-binding domain-containing protein [Bacteriovorax stolpii]AUN98362.1 fatty oxidation complex subunit alpha [Bacteriovorax stolpii]TDP51017.1 3-hydroxyacyl-CoA dehydrogenase/enoyl-CoA hydratase/3-hydroxybutyryl-CoA epimerase [Bacteriovorax stolpii]
MANNKISLEYKNDIAYIGFGFNSTKSMTTLDIETMMELMEIVEELHTKGTALKGAIFFSHKENCFLAGADINLIASMRTEAEAADGAERGQNIYNRIEDLQIPTVVCVDGVCLGGGLELSLSCKAIIASNSSKTSLGLPEVKLGLIPGFGGTYRLPRKIGLPNALDMILTGKTLRADKAKRIGLVEEVYPRENLLAMAPNFFNRKAKPQSIKESMTELATENFVTRKIIFQKVRESVLKKTNGFYQAPLKILDVMDSGMMKGRTSYLASEAQAFGELAISEQSKNLQHIYFMSEAVKKYNGPKSTKPLPVLSRGAALGAGTMGGGIAWLMAEAGMQPIMKDLTTDALNLGLKQSSQNFQGALKRKKITPDEFERKQRSITAQLDYSGFKKIDLVIEAVVENMDIKKKVFAETEKQVHLETLLTSNTSSLSVQEMSKALERPERFAGLHFFNPVHLMPLVEIIIHDKIAPETIEALHKWVLRVKKTPVIVKDGPGFLVNRILMPYLNEAGYLLEEGVSVKDLDQAALNFGMPMGPARLLDEVGIDVAVKVGKVMHDGLGARAYPSKMSGKLSEKNFLGKKTSKGFYLYDEKGKVTGPNPEVEELLPKEKKKMSESELQMRLFLPMINEAAAILKDGIVETAADVDLGLIFGIGFPPFRGGLLRYADSEGLDKILGALKNFSETVDRERYTPNSYLTDLVETKTTFYEKAK